MSEERIGQKIKSVRIGLGWTVPELARRAKIKLRTLEDIENEITKDPGYYNVSKVLNVLSKATGKPIVSFYESENVTSLPRFVSPDFRLAPILLNGFDESGPIPRLLALYLLTGDDEYRAQVGRLPDGPRLVSWLGKILSSS